MRLLFTALFIVATAAGSYAQDLSYQVDLRNSAQGEVQVTVETKATDAPITSYQMPAWAPGAYSVTNYGRFVKNITASDENNHPVELLQVNENRWEAKQGRNIHRLIYTVINSYKDSTSLYFALAQIDTNFFFANGTALFGYANDKKNVRSQIRYDFPSSWKLYTALDGKEADFHLDVTAKDYDELADAPVMGGKGFEYRTFTQDGAVYDIIVASNAPFPMDSLTEATKRIVKSQTDFFGDTPFKRYVFLINAPTFSHLPVQNGFGALEHSNSSAYLFFNTAWGALKENLNPILSHEFFHLWNVKRIHSDKLGPFDYTKRVMTTSLWLSEGVTDYYGNSLLSRSGIFPPKSFEQKMSEWMNAMAYGAANSESLEQLSIDESAFDLQKALVFYYKGPLVAWMLDVEIRTQTKNKKSLDDVMHSLYAEAKKGLHFSDEALIGKVEKISGAELKNFYSSYIKGNDSLPLAEYLHKMGIIKEQEITVNAGMNLGARFDYDLELPVIKEFTEHSLLEAAGMMKGDTILSFEGGKPASLMSLEEFSLNKKVPQTLTLDIARGTNHFSKTITFTEPRSTHTEKKTMFPNENASPLEKKIRKEIYGG